MTYKDVFMDVLLVALIIGTALYLIIGSFYDETVRVFAAAVVLGVLLVGVIGLISIPIWLILGAVI